MNKPVSPEVLDQWISLECSKESLRLELQVDRNNLASEEMRQAMGLSCNMLESFRSEYMKTKAKLESIKEGITQIESEYKGKLDWSSDKGHFVKYF